MGKARKNETGEPKRKYLKVSEEIVLIFPGFVKGGNQCGLKISRSLLQKKKSVSAFQAEHFSKRKLIGNKQ